MGVESGLIGNPPCKVKSPSKLTSIRVLSLKEEGERETKHENAYSLRERVGLLWHKVGMEIKHKYENAKSIRQLSLNPKQICY